MPATSSGYFSLWDYFLISLIFVTLDQSRADKQLKFVLLVYRHGDRSPVHTYINDQHQESSWPDGFGQLTKIGIQQHYELGKYLRKRYSGFLNESYSRHEVYIRSSNVDRTIMSAQANLAGLFPPAGEQIWNPNLPWQPIPVHMVSPSEDKVYRAKIGYLMNQLKGKRQMIEVKRLIIQLFNGLTWKQRSCRRLLQHLEEFLKNISNASGLSIEELKADGIWTTYDALFCETIHNYTLPAWATAETMAKLSYLSEISLARIFGIHKQLEKSRLQGGVLLNTIIKNITSILSKPTSKRKMIMYSAHDTTIAALQTALNVSNGKQPPYASCHIFELYIDEIGQYSIEMYYRNDSTVNPYPLTLPGCDASCPLQKFIDLTSPVITEDWIKECGIVDKSSTQPRAHCQHSPELTVSTAQSSLSAQPRAHCQHSPELTVSTAQSSLSFSPELPLLSPSSLSAQSSLSSTADSLSAGKAPLSSTTQNSLSSTAQALHQHSAHCAQHSPELTQ
ncbi:prostatic acid phosphatase isoform X2 [Pelobates cultripes]|uniref:acid phosphatase n=1 Tax=Pelobates cultripes TaxID=61616 RepID=A0AAD1W1J5_PELCU|nr:prostatic acid phosphatase isoform X2 [Pelobates cultripes]